MTELNKIELFEKGYTTFNIYNLNDVEINNALDELYTLSKKKFNCLRYCRLGGMEMSHLKDEFEKLEKEKQIQLKNDLYEIFRYTEIKLTIFQKVSNLHSGMSTNMNAQHTENPTENNNPHLS